MTVHEFGNENEKTVVLIHPSAVMWDYFEYVIPLLETKYHLVIPALPGYDKDCPCDFTSVEEIAAELADWLDSHGIKELSCIYGCSMGGSVVTRFLADNRIKTDCAVIDGGIMPYQLPYIVTRLIAVKDFLLVFSGKLGGIKLIEKAFTYDEYSKEDLRYIAEVLKMMSAKTIWHTFDSCNNYSMPADIKTECGRIEYWYASTEKKARKTDIEYIKNIFPQTVFREFENVGHGGLAALKPGILADEISKLCEKGE